MKHCLVASIISLFLLGSCNENHNAVPYNSVLITTSETDSIVQVHNSFPFLAKYNFAAYTSQLYNGKLADPDFKNNPDSGDPEYVKFIIDGCKQGINFGGHYTVIEKSCGAMCSQLVMVDRRNGKIFVGTTGLIEEDGYYGFEFKKNSSLLITNASVLTDLSTGESNEFSITPQVFKWEKDHFELLE
jgi:hypothetical protein